MKLKCADPVIYLETDLARNQKKKIFISRKIHFWAYLSDHEAQALEYRVDVKGNRVGGKEKESNAKDCKRKEGRKGGREGGR